MDRTPDPQPEDDQQLADWLAVPGGPRPTVWHAAPPPQPGCLSDQVAWHLLHEHAQAGDIVVDVDDDIAFAATAAATGRRHHALGGDIHLATLGHVAGYIDLILLHWPRPAVNTHWLLLACKSLLSATGHLVVAVCVDPVARVAHLSGLAGAAATAGLRPVRHVAVVAPQGAALDIRAHGSPATAGESRIPGVEPPPVSPHTDLLILN